MKLKEQILLGIEGAGSSVSVGIMDQGTSLGQIFLNGKKTNSETLLVAIDLLLQNLELKKEAIQGICINQGPGSFTSLRVSIATAEALGISLDVPVYGANALLLIAETASFYPETIRVIQDAYKGEFYAASFIGDGKKVKEVEEIHLITPQRFFDSLQENELILGTGIQRLEKLGLELATKKVKSDLCFSRQPSGISVIEHFLENEAQEPSLTPLEPIYVRPSDAEISYVKKYGE